MEPKTGKRIVSRREYTANIGKKFLCVSGGLFFILIGLIAQAKGIVALLNHLSQWGGILDALVGSFFFLFASGFLSVCLIVLGHRVIVDARNFDPGLPLNYTNTALLPATESLVRASSEPTQAQEAVLLRAAAEGMETPPEQLVRASVGQE